MEICKYFIQKVGLNVLYWRGSLRHIGFCISPSGLRLHCLCHKFLWVAWSTHWNIALLCPYRLLFHATFFVSNPLIMVAITENVCENHVWLARILHSYFVSRPVRTTCVGMCFLFKIMVPMFYFVLLVVYVCIWTLWCNITNAHRLIYAGPCKCGSHQHISQQCAAAKHKKKWQNTLLSSAKMQ